MDRLRGVAVWALGLALCNYQIVRFSPRPAAISGNGFHPLQMLALFGAGLCGLGLLLAMMRLAALWADRNLHPRYRSLAAACACLVSLLLLAHAWNAFGAFETTTAYYHRLGPEHRFGLFNPYTVAYWATSWSFWLGLSGLGLSLGLSSREPSPRAGKPA